MRGDTKDVCIYEFVLLSNLRLHKFINMPFFLSQTLQNMAHYANTSRHPLSSLTNHGLIKLLVLICLAHNNLTWEQFVGVAVHQEPAVACIRGRRVKQSASYLVAGRDEE